MDNLIINVNKILKKNYPLKISFDKINTLSHFWIKSNNFNKFLNTHMSIDGRILNGQYKNYQIVKVITTEILDWNKYLELYVSFLNKSRTNCSSKSLWILFIYFPMPGPNHLFYFSI